MFVMTTFGVAGRYGAGWMSRLRLFGLGAALAVLCCAFLLAKAETALAAGEATTYTATETVPVPPASNFAGSGGGDGWSVALSNTQVFNVFHHQGNLQVVCHNQSDASVCWGPDTITDASGNNFATSGHPGMYLDPNTGKLWVYATRTSTDPTKDLTGGVVCIDTTLPAPPTPPDVNRFCGFVPLTHAGEASTQSGFGQLSNPVQFGNRLYAFNYVTGVAAPVGGENALLCFNLSTDAPCPLQPYPGHAGTGLVASGAPSPAISLVGNQLIIPININGASELACVNASTLANCSGSWPVSLTSTNYSPGSEGPPFPLQSSSGNTIGLCLPDGIDECFGLNGSTQPTPSGMQAAIGGGSVSWSGPGLLLGPRVYVPAWSNVVYCYDA